VGDQRLLAGAGRRAGRPGLAAAALLSSSLALLAQDFAGPDRARALGVWAATVAAAFAIGPLEGGLLTEALGWGDDLIVASLAGAAVLLAAFVAVERRERYPMLDLGLFATPTFTGASLAVLAMAGCSFGPFVYLTLFLLDATGASPTAVGLELPPLSAAAFVVSILGGRYATRLPVRAALPAGLLLCAAGLLAMRGLAVSSPWNHLLPGLLLTGAGLGLANPAVTYAALGVVPTARSGMAAGINNTFRQVGLAVGVAALGTLLPAGATGQADAFARALDDMLLVSAATVTAAAAAALLLVRQRDFVAEPRPTPVPAHER
jgi:predicted MFS family arabinose efflux permease